MSSRRAYNAFRKMKSGSVGGQSRVATPVSPHSFAKAVSSAPSPAVAPPYTPTEGTWSGNIDVGTLLPASSVPVLMPMTEAVSTHAGVGLEPVLNWRVSVPAGFVITSATAQVTWDTPTESILSPTQVLIMIFEGEVLVYAEHSSNVTLGELSWAINSSEGTLSVGTPLPYTVPEGGAFIAPAFVNSTWNTDKTTQAGGSFFVFQFIG